MVRPAVQWGDMGRYGEIWEDYAPWAMARPAVQAELFRSYVTEWQVGSSQQRASHAASDGSSPAAHITRATPYP